VRPGRVIAALLAGGLMLLAAGLALYSYPADAQSRTAALAPIDYTNHPARAATGRTLNLYVDHDFDPRERDRIVSALRQWNHVLNGMIRLEAKLLPQDVSAADLQRLKRSGGWLVLRVDSRHRIAHSGEGKDALAVTVGGTGGGVVYVISDRIGGRDLSGVVMHEFGHVLGAGHGQRGLMAPVYSLDGARCIDYAAVSLVAQAQRLPVNSMNWCEGPGRERTPTANLSASQGTNQGYKSSSVRGRAQD
jgi:hypothetical protein